MPKGNQSDFEGILQRHFEEVYGYVAFRVAPDIDAAADITQEVFLAAVRSWGAYRGDGSPLTWLRGIARRKVADHFRTSASATVHCNVDALPGPGEPQPGLKERALLISHVMQSLPESHADVLEEKYLEGLSVREIARRRKITEKAVESALSRARQAFRERYEKLQAREETRK